MPKYVCMPHLRKNSKKCLYSNFVLVFNVNPGVHANKAKYVKLEHKKSLKTRDDMLSCNHMWVLPTYYTILLYHSSP